MIFSKIERPAELTADSRAQSAQVNMTPELLVGG